MADRTPIDKLASSVSRVLKGYGEDVRRNMDIITQKMGDRGARALREQSAGALKQHTGTYVKGWKYEFRKTTRMSAGRTMIFNDHYSLPHLLEHGHVTRNGTGRTMPPTPGHEHIAPVAEALVETYEREVLAKL